MNTLEWKHLKTCFRYCIDQINEFSDITVKYEQHKKGRSISGFSFSFKPKKATIRSIETNRDPNTTDLSQNDR
jgi:plasmid replication initiation protein